MKLNQALAILKGLKTQAHTTMTAFDKQCQKRVLFGGFTKTFQPLDEDGEKFPPESHPVSTRVKERLNDIRQKVTEHLDIEITRDYGNMTARADIKIDDELIVASVPVATLLFLEKQCNDWHALIGELPVLASDKKWTWDPQQEIHVSEGEVTHRTKKVQKPIVLYDATDKHPAQTQMVTEDVTIGHWHTTHLSGAVTYAERREMLARVVKFRQAVQKAREEANSIEVEQRSLGKPMLDYILGPQA